MLYAVQHTEGHALFILKTHPQFKVFVVAGLRLLSIKGSPAPSQTSITGDKPRSIFGDVEQQMPHQDTAKTKVAKVRLCVGIAHRFIVNANVSIFVLRVYESMKA